MKRRTRSSTARSAAARRATDDRFCEACGAASRAPATPRRRWARTGSSRSRPTRRGERPRPGAHRGTRTPTPSPLEDQAVVAVVCDGVSSSTAGDVAARVAADAAGQRARRPDAAPTPPATLTGAIETRVAGRRRGRVVTDARPAAPSTTIVAATWRGGVRSRSPVSATAAPTGSTTTSRVRLTRDDSWAEDQVRSGGCAPTRRSLDRAGAHDHRLARRPTRPTHAPAVVSFRPVRRGRLLLCSDGLWNSWPEPDDLAELVLRVGRPPRRSTSRRALHRSRRRRRRPRQHHRRRGRRLPRPHRAREGLMTTFSASVHQNQFLAVGASRSTRWCGSPRPGAAAATARPRPHRHAARSSSSTSPAPWPCPSRSSRRRSRPRSPPSTASRTARRSASSPGATRCGSPIPATGARGRRRRDPRRRQGRGRNLRAGGGTAIGAWLQRAANMFAIGTGRDPPRDPHDRRPEPERDAGGAGGGDRGVRPIGSSATAAASATTGRSTSSGPSPPPCSAASTSSPMPPTPMPSPPTSSA